MLDVLAGIRVIEVATWTFVPISGAVLAEWGADVIKVEHPASGDPQRGLVSSGLVPGGDGVNFMFEIPNRGKRSVGLDISTDDGRERSEEHTSELQSRLHLVCRLLLEKKKKQTLTALNRPTYCGVP